MLNQQSGATGGLPSFISYDRFRELCEPHDVAGDSAETLAKTLSLQGRLDYHGDGRNPSQLVILNPEWLMKAIAYVISDRAVTENKGILTRQRLAPIWHNHQRPASENPERYEPRLWPPLLELMAGHEIVYQLTKDEWVVAQLVPEAPPAEIPWTIDDGKGTIRLHCDLTDKIRGLMALLTVRNHYHHVDRQRLFWQRGAFLRQPHTKAEALVTIDGEDKIRLEVRGDHGQLMGELVGSLERLIYEMWPGAERDGEPPFKYYVPCPSPGCKGRFGRRDLIADLYDEEVDTARCEGGGRHSHDIRALLHGVGLPSQDRKLDKVLERISHVQSYISSEAPRIVAIEQVERGALNPMQLLNSKVRVRIHCEVLKEPVEDAEEILKFEKGWWGVVKRWGPFATSIVALGVPLTGVEVAPSDPGFEKAAKEGREALKTRGGDEPDVGPSFGVLVRPDGAHLPNAFKEKLIAIAKKGGMTQVQMDSDGRWVWVCQEVAERNDRSIAKEPPKTTKARGGRRAS